MIYLAENLKFLRSQAKASQEVFASRIGVSRSSLNAYEHRDSEPPIPVLRQICQKLGVSMDEMLNEGLSNKRVFLSEGKVSKTRAWLDAGNRI